MTMWQRACVAGFALVVMASATALAQKPVAAANTAGCTPQEKSTQTLHLNQGNGVICPPDVDPGSVKAPPAGGTMPVIPPPGSPGGNPNVQPK